MSTTTTTAKLAPEERAQLRYLLSTTLAAQLECYRQILDVEVDPTSDKAIERVRTLSHHFDRATAPTTKRSCLEQRTRDGNRVLREVEAALNSTTESEGAKREVAMTVCTTLRSYCAVLDKETPDEEVLRIHKATVKGVVGLGDMQTAMWDDALEHGIPEMLKENNNDGVMVTQPIESLKGASVSMCSIDAVVGLDETKARGIFCMVLSERLDKVAKATKEELATTLAVSNKYSAASASEVYQRELEESKLAYETMRQIHSEVQSLADEWGAVSKDFLEYENLVWFEATTQSKDPQCRRKYGVAPTARSSELYAAMATAVQTKWEAVAAKGRAIDNKLVRVAAEFIAPLRHVRARETYAETMYVRYRIMFSIPVAAGDSSSSSLYHKISIESFEAVCDAEGTPYPATLQLSRHQNWFKAGEVPTIVAGRRCTLTRMREMGLALEKAYENPSEYGGHFIINGTEKFLRILTVPRANVPIRLCRGHFQRNGKNFSDKAVMFRSKMPSGRAVATYFHYVCNGEIVMSFAKKYVHYVPTMVLLLALKDTSLQSVYNCLVAGLTSPASLARVEAFVQHHGTKPYAHVVGQTGMASVLGRLFRELQGQRRTALSFLPECIPNEDNVCQHSDVWYGRYLLRRYLFPHLNSAIPFDADLSDNADSSVIIALQQERDRKFELLLHIIRTLHGFVEGNLSEEVVDKPSHQEVFTLRNMFVGVVDDCIQRHTRFLALVHAQNMSVDVLETLRDYRPSERLPPSIAGKLAVQKSGILAPLMRIFSTGSYAADSDLGMPVPQNVGLSIVAERMNVFRVVEQLRGIHRGRHILEMRSSEVRRCAAETWGFYCVVHTPDGEACGVQNQLSLSAFITRGDNANVRKRVKKYLGPHVSLTGNLKPEERFAMAPIMLDGEAVAYVSKEYVFAVGKMMMDAKLQDPQLADVEVVSICGGKGLAPLLHIFTTQGRLMRPVKQVANGRQMNVGSWEQTYLNIASVYADLGDARTEAPNVFDFIEPNCANLLSITASVIPFFEHNCSPRNLFQCGITKQSVGPPYHPAAFRHDTKLYHQPHLQRCVVRTGTMDEYSLDKHNVNVNAVLAVASYSGMDMEDALILNRNAVQRGMFSVYQTLCKCITATSSHKTIGDTNAKVVAVFHNVRRNGTRVCPSLGINGLPIGRRPTSEVSGNMSQHHGAPSFTETTPIYCVARKVTYSDGTVEYLDHNVVTWDSLDKGEAGWIHTVIPTSYDGADITNAMLILRLKRDPVIGDKFCSRHGQKGTLSFNMPTADLPFTDGGIMPDVLINPHAFPSRMAVGMMLEMIGGKYACLEGTFIDGSAWKLVDDKPISTHELGDLLTKHGMRRYGRDVMYNGTTGEPMDVDIFIGIGGYQRLRHMVRDKWQVRSRTDHVRNRVIDTTGQPVHGRKVHGGVRVGEMERDALISHGASEIVIDRLLNVSDKTRTYLCANCGGMLCFMEKSSTTLGTWKVCYYCGAGESANGDAIKLVDIPQVLRLMVAEMASAGIRTCIGMNPE
eukprot:PhM_4_TR2645/c0_g1_i1/m.76424/K03002/RPA2, POLR1B; DNA-directed RNA polymerase I subunit RPA2